MFSSISGEKKIIKSTLSSRGKHIVCIKVTRVGLCLTMNTIKTSFPIYHVININLISIKYTSTLLL